MFKLFAVHGEKDKPKKGRPPKKEKSSDEKAGKGGMDKAEAIDGSPSAAVAAAVKKDKEGKKKTADIPSFPMKDGKPGKKRSNPAAGDKPAAKKAKAKGPDAFEEVYTSDPKSFVRRRVSKNFDGEIFYGTIMEYDGSETPPLWHVEYDDGDEEDFEKKDLIKALKHYQKHGMNDPSKTK